MLTDHSVAPQNGQKPEYLVIFFHPSGSTGEMMAHKVGTLLGPLMPEAKIRCPDGPVDLNWGGIRDWFPIKDLTENGTKSPDSYLMAERASAAAQDVNAYIDRVIAEEGIPENRVILAGFSLGATMAFYAALLRDKPVGAVCCLSGGAIDKFPLAQAKSKPPVGLLAGAKEDGHYFNASQPPKTRDALEAAGFRTDCVIIPGQDHDITWKSMELLAVFARNVTAEPKQDNHPQVKPRRNAGPRL
jgi:phospholipase/carboxylesterase